MKTFDQLKEWQQRALYLHVYHGLNGSEIATRLKVPQRTVYDNLKRYEYIDKDTIVDITESPTIAPVIKNQPKLLFWDIEIGLGKAYHFDHWGINITEKHKILPSYLLSHAWAWNDGDIDGSILTAPEIAKRDTKRLVEECWKLLDECDILVAHNGKKFDVKMINGYFLKYGMPPPSPYRVIDTYVIAKKKFKLAFNTLGHLARYLGVVEKIETGGIDLWIGCDQLDQESIDKMLEYNKGDIDTLREVYKKLRAWDNDAVNFATFNQDTDMACPHCGSGDVEMVPGKYVYTSQVAYQMYVCNECSAKLRGNEKVVVGNKLHRVA